MTQIKPDSQLHLKTTRTTKNQKILETAGSSSAETEQHVHLWVCHSLHHSLLLTCPHISISAIASRPLQASKSATLVASLSTTPGPQGSLLQQLFTSGFSWPCHCRRGLSNSTCTASCPRPKTKEPFTLDCNMFATVFCSFFPSLPFTTAWLVQSQQLNEREKLSFLPQSGMGEEVSHSAPA